MDWPTAFTIVGASPAAAFAFFMLLKFLAGQKL